MTPLTILMGRRPSKVHIQETSRVIRITTYDNTMPLRKPAPMPRPILKKPRAPAPPQAAATPEDHPASPPSSSGSPSFDDALTTLSEDIRLLVRLLFQKLDQNSSIYDHDATKADILHHEIRKVMRRVQEHPIFPDIENDIPEANFYIAWGILKAESLRWGQGPGLKEDRGKVAREQKAIRMALKEMGVDVDGSIEENKEQQEAKAMVMKAGEKEGVSKAAKGGMVGLKRVLNQMVRDGRFKARQGEGKM